MKNSKKAWSIFTCVFVIIILLFSAVIIPAWYFGKLKVLDFEWDDNYFLGVDQPVTDLSINLFIDTVSAGSIALNSEGRAYIYITQEGDYTFEFRYKEIIGSYDFNETSSSIEYFELETYLLDTTIEFVWTSDMSPIPDGSLGLLMWDGDSFETVSSVSIVSGVMTSDLYLGLGEFMFEGANESFVIDQQTSDLEVPTEIYFDPTRIITSIIMYLAGIIIMIAKPKTKIYASFFFFLLFRCIIL